MNACSALPNDCPTIPQVRRVQNGRTMIVFEEFETKTGGRLDTVDVTDDVEKLVSRSGVKSGNALVFSPHTTCAVLIGAPGELTAASLRHAMQSIAPDAGYYAHDDLDIRTENLVENEPANAPAHIVHCLVGKTSESVPIMGGRLMLGDGQRVLFVELDSSRLRRYSIQVIGE